MPNDQASTIDIPRQKELLEEYKDASSNMRQYGNMRFAHLALFMVATACLFRTSFTDSPSLSPSLGTAIKVVGIVLTLVFAILHHRVVCHFHNYRRRAVQLEKHLHFSQHSSRKEDTWFRAATALWVVYVSFIMVWILALFL